MSTKPVTRIARVWTGSRHQAAQIPVGDLEALQKRFRHRLEIVHTADGGMTITPDIAGDQTAFDAFMVQHTAFTPQMMRI